MHLHRIQLPIPFWGYRTTRYPEVSPDTALRHIGKESCVHRAAGWLPIHCGVETCTQAMLMAYLRPHKCTLFLSLCWFVLLPMSLAVFLPQRVRQLTLATSFLSDAIQGIGHQLYKKPSPRMRVEMLERVLSSISSNIYIPGDKDRPSEGRMLRDVLFNYIRTILAPCTIFWESIVPCFTSQLGEVWNLSLIQYQCWLAKHEPTYQFLEAKNKRTDTTRSYLSRVEISLNQTSHPEQHCHQQTQKCHDLSISGTLCVGCKTDSQNILQNEMHLWCLSAWKPDCAFPCTHEGRNSHG